VACRLSESSSPDITPKSDSGRRVRSRGSATKCLLSSAASPCILCRMYGYECIPITGVPILTANTQKW
jgi:hypothetical protein